MWASHFVRNGNKLSISSYMVGHRSTGLPECGPTESSAPEPCCLCFRSFSTFLATKILDAYKWPQKGWRFTAGKGGEEERGGGGAKYIFLCVSIG